MVAFRDKLIAGRKTRRHEQVGDDLDLAVLEKIIRDFRQPDHELWDKKNRHLLLVFKTTGNQTVKLSSIRG